MKSIRLALQLSLLSSQTKPAVSIFGGREAENTQTNEVMFSGRFKNVQTIVLGQTLDATFVMI